MRPHGSAKADRRFPRAWGICDRCGFLYTKNDLSFQYEWYGARTQNTNLLVCERCMDNLQEQLRAIVLPADPQPILNPRPEATTLDNPVTSIGAAIGTMTQAAGLAAAFDSNSNKPMFLSACQYISTAGANYVGRSWQNIASNNAGLTAKAFVAYAPNDAKFFGGGAAAYTFDGSNNTIAWTTISSGTTAGTVGETISVSVTPTTAYLYHRFSLTGDGINSVAIAQLTINCAGLA